jgi:small-conductance mechanosensitive channel
MLGRVVLWALQAAVAWVAGPFLFNFARTYIPGSGALDLFIYAAVFALIVYVIGLLAALVVKPVGSPSLAALAMSLILALIAAAFATYGLELIPQIHAGTIAKRAIVLAGAVLGLAMKR